MSAEASPGADPGDAITANPAKRGLDGICTNDTAHFVRAVRREKAVNAVCREIALKGGERLPGQTYIAKWNVYCDDPVRVAQGTDARKTKFSQAREYVIDAPCRKCAKCLQFRQMRWRQRAMTEIAQAERTWFVTLTFSPVHLAGILAEAAVTERTEERCAYDHVQRYLKRLRKAGYPLRYLAVYERGEKNGRSHYHLLLHEAGRPPVPKAVLENQWRSIVHGRLVADDDGAAAYVTKYATKDSTVRLRASRSYGKDERTGKILPVEEFFPLLNAMKEGD
jgi:hypothetical protein